MFYLRVENMGAKKIPDIFAVSGICVS